MRGSGYRPSRDAVAAPYGAVSGWPMLRHKSDGISGPYSNGKSRRIYMSSIPKNDPGTNLRLSLDNRRS